MTMEELSNVQGRAWDDVDVSMIVTTTWPYSTDKFHSTDVECPHLLVNSGGGGGC